jgi:hypothetical protein
VGSAAVAHAQNAASLPAVTPGEVKAAQAMLPACGCPPNAGEVEYALKELGVKSLSLKLLVKRLGNATARTPAENLYHVLRAAVPPWRPLHLQVALDRRRLAPGAHDRGKLYTAVRDHA